MEHAMCSYFTVEIIIRTIAFQSKLMALTDTWFVFDLCLVSMMVIETWIMTAIIEVAGSLDDANLKNGSVLRLFRLMRLARMARLVRLIRAIPELMILIKGTLPTKIFSAPEEIIVELISETASQILKKNK